ncbi:hypothetical protein FOA52_004692, partial [Chlamydomonas sp. UWO 241]
ARALLPALVAQHGHRRWQRAHRARAASAAHAHGQVKKGGGGSAALCRRQGLFRLCFDPVDGPARRGGAAAHQRGCQGHEQQARREHGRAPPCVCMVGAPRAPTRRQPRGRAHARPLRGSLPPLPRASVAAVGRVECVGVGARRGAARGAGRARLTARPVVWRV